MILIENFSDKIAWFKHKPTLGKYTTKDYSFFVERKGNKFIVSFDDSYSYISNTRIPPFQVVGFDLEKSIQKSIQKFNSLNKEQGKYSEIPNLWKGDSLKLSKALIDHNISIEKYVSSQRSSSKYIYLMNGDKIRISDHELPLGYESADYNFFFGDSIKDFINTL